MAGIEPKVEAKGPNEAETIAKLALAAAGQVQVLKLEHPDGKGETFEVIARPCGGGAVALESTIALREAERAAPERKRGTARMLDTKSFCEFFNRHKDESSAIFLNNDRKAPSLTGVLNYHHLDKRTPPDGVIESLGAPRFGDHRVRYEFPLSDEWKAWTEQNGEKMGQAEFAYWIENRILDLMDPSSADDSIKAFANKLGTSFADVARMIGLSRGLSLEVNSKMTKAVTLDSGETVMNFLEEHVDAQGKPLKVPGAFVLAIPVFQGEGRFQVAVRLRYRPSGGSVTWWFELYQPEKVFDLALDGAVHVVGYRTSVEPFTGSPES